MAYMCHNTHLYILYITYTKCFKNSYKENKDNSEVGQKLDKMLGQMHSFISS